MQHATNYSYNFTTLHNATLHQLRCITLQLQLQPRLQLHLQLPLRCTTLHFANNNTLQLQLHHFTLHYARLHYTIPHYRTKHYSTRQYITIRFTIYTTPQLQLQLRLQLHYTNYITLQLQLTTTTPPRYNYNYHYNYNYNYHYNYNYNCTTPRYIQQLWWGDHCNHYNHFKNHNSNYLSVHQWIRSAIRDSQRPTSPIGFWFLKLPPPPCAVLLVYRWCSVKWLAL